MDWGALAVVAALLIIGAGCAAVDSGKGGPTSTEMPSTPTPPPEQSESTPTTLNAIVTFQECNPVTIAAADYDTILVALQGGETAEFSGNFSSEQSFETDAPIQEVLVADGNRSIVESNPAYDPCIGTSNTTSGPFDPAVTFSDCRNVTIEAANFSRVAITTNSGIDDRRGNYTGDRTFVSDTPIREVMVFGPEEAVVVENEDYVECVTTPTPTPTSTPEPTVPPHTHTETVTPTSTPEPPTEDDVSIRLRETPPDDPDGTNGTYRVDIYVQNFYGDPVDVSFTVVLWERISQFTDGEREVYSEEFDLDVEGYGPDEGTAAVVEYDGPNASNVTRASAEEVE